MTAEILATGYRSQAGFSLLKVLLAAVLFTMSWNDFLRLPYGLTVPNVSLLFLFICIFINILLHVHSYKVNKKLFFFDEIILLIFFLFAVVSSVINIDNYKIQTFAFYFLAYAFFFATRISAARSGLSSLWMIRMSAYGVFFVSAIIILEFTLRNLFYINIHEFFTRAREATATFRAGSFNIYRPYGLTTEPNIIAFYFNVFGVLYVAYCLSIKKISLILKSIFIAFFLLAYVLLFSPTLIILLYSVCLSFVIRFLMGSTYLKNISLGNPISFVIKVFTFGVVSLGALIPFVGFVLPGLAAKVTALLSGEGDRSELWRRALEDIASSNIWLGNGPGSFSKQSGMSAVNWYLTLLGENGLLGLFCIFLFFFFILLRIARSRVPYAFAFTAGIIGGATHLITTSMFWNPYIWVLLGIFGIATAENTRKTSNV